MLELALIGEVVIPGYTKYGSIKVAREIYPKLKLFHILISPSKATEDDPVLREKYLIESIAKLREFVWQLWPRKTKRGRVIEIDKDWFKAKD
jgi:hypothetical protein